MNVKQIVPNLYTVSLGPVNAFLIEAADGLTLIDTGFPDSAGQLLEAVRALGRSSTDINHILVTHCHADHSGSLAALKKATGAPAYMHPLDAALVRTGESMRPVNPAPGLIYRLIYYVFIKRSTPAAIEATDIEHEVEDGQELAVAGGIRAIHTPGHCAGQLAFLWPQQDGVLFAGDTATHFFGLGYPPIFEDLAEGRRSLAKVAALNFETACFGHGKALVGGAAAKFRKKWGN